ncbi:hypothetical protein DFH07DRAFT_1007636 [Mycena maculata]|uniref:EH domain-containing protein n=1 Tax=Mycena maculata TaxID=230809 RepID=A0AAD7MLF0_9AGAR|nr:hypothetical protein DFH07DRAFT_1007636 [Mycena maculata]
MPASSLQSRISAFESLSNQRPVLQTPLSPRVIPSTPPRASPSPSPPNLGRKSSLIDLKDWVLDDGSPPRPNAFRQKSDDDPLIHFSPPKPSSVKAPPLPPRKPSLASLKSIASSSSLPLKSSTPMPPPTRRGDSLTVEHTYPPPLDLSPGGRGHTHASSVSSFHSVSLSDSSPSPQTTTFPQQTTGSSAESFEELSASTALASPTTAALISHDWEKAMARRQPPKLPARPVVPAISQPPARRAAPPPPPSDRASIASVSSVSSKSTSKSVSTVALTARPPPVPPGPRKRYETLFTSLLSAHGPAPPPALLTPRRRTAAGWRGLSVDLTSPGAADEPECLPGPVVCVLWARSRLPRPTLSAIWTECDPGRTGALDREAFVRGMWRIDEELRRAEVNRSGSLNGQRRLR